MQTVPSSQSPQAKQSHRLPFIIIGASLLGLLAILFTCVGVFVVVNVLNPYHSYKISDAVMEPALHAGQTVLVKSYGSSTPKRGDIVAFHPPGQGGAVVIQRIVALPGEQFIVNIYEVTINGQKLDEPYLPTPRQQNSRIFTLKLGPQQYLLMGDNRHISTVFDPINLSDIVGVLYRII